MTEWRLFASDALVVLGTAAMTLALFGVVRGRDTNFKIHAGAKATVVGVLLVLSASVAGGGTALVARAFVVGFFLLLTAAASSHVLARLERRLRDTNREFERQHSGTPEAARDRRGSAG